MIFQQHVTGDHDPLSSIEMVQECYDNKVVASKIDFVYIDRWR
jgi:hypothetical protein